MMQIQDINNFAKSINQILTNTNLFIEQKIDKLMTLFCQKNAIYFTDFKLIDRYFKGQYGSEYLIIGKKQQKIIEFYQFLANRFPENYQIKLSLADLFLLNHQYNDSFNLFNQVFIEQPLLIFESPGELYEILAKYGSNEHKIRYSLSLVRAFFKDDNPEDAWEEYQATIEKYGDDNENIKEYLEQTDLSSILVRSPIL